MRTVKFLFSLTILLVWIAPNSLWAQANFLSDAQEVNSNTFSSPDATMPVETSDVNTGGFIVGLHYMKGLHYSLNMEIAGNSSSASGKWDVGGLGIKIGYDWLTRYSVNKNTGKPVKFKSQQVYIAYSKLDEGLNMLEVGTITSWSMFKSPFMFSSGVNLATLSDNGLGGGFNLGLEYIAPIGEKANLRPYLNLGTMFLWKSESDISYRLNPLTLKIGLACSFN